MKNPIVEISKKTTKAGRLPITLILHEVYPDTNSYNKNGISWNREYTELNIDSVKSMPIVTQFIDSENSIPLGGHGSMNTIDGDVYFEDSLVVGAFEDAYIKDDIEINGKTISALIGKGYIYNQRFPLFTQFLQEQHENNIPIEGSVEINADKSKGHEKIIYDGGYRERGRVPQLYQYSGHALLFGEQAADDSALMLELNSYKNKPKEGENKSMSKIELNAMNYEDISILVENAFNKKFNENKSNYYWFYAHKFYPTISTFIMKSWDKIGEYYKTTYSIEDGVLKIGDIVKVEESWKPVEDVQSVEVNTPIKKIIKGGNKGMEGLIREKDQKIEELTNQISEVNTKNTELASSVEELNTKINELNTTLVEVNKTLEDVKKEKEELSTEVNSLKEYKDNKEQEIKKAEVNAYFETEIPKNGFEEVEVNTLKEYVEKCDLEGLKKAEADLIVKKFKESSKKVETNASKENLFFHTNEEKLDDIEAGKALFN